MKATKNTLEPIKMAQNRRHRFLDFRPKIFEKFSAKSMPQFIEFRPLPLEAGFEIVGSHSLNWPITIQHRVSHYTV
jgi:hypothetical protein